MMKLRSKKLFKRSSSKLSGGGGAAVVGVGGRGEIEWELRPGGMLVQKREGRGVAGELITVRVSTTAGSSEMKEALSMLTGLEPREQRLVFKGKEREDGDHLHMVGVRDGDKVLLLQDPAIKEKKLLLLQQAMAGLGSTNCHTIIQV
ncbi:BAG family molecular chaperone regulator 2 [Ananas comosus]|uniref:BAG family molecular chaperone regulator 2 n=1 Tax=Ananas comosus TaxID=4615 RepID=A0A199V9I3_ANACO|nr:BAG family molecular chaperone regulator 2 [Ananas comosus]